MRVLSSREQVTSVKVNRAISRQTLFDEVREAEIRVLGGIIMSLRPSVRIRTRLKLESFLHTANRIIYRAMSELDA